METLIVAVIGLLGIAGARMVAPRLGFPAPLLLVVVGIAVSFLPFIPGIEVNPEWIIAGVLPPLLYSASVAMPTMEFRRDFAAISGLSVALVVISSVILGFVFAWLIPDLGIAGGIALGAIVSPTDAVATTIVKRVGVSPRIVAVLEGESLLNDATALVLLRAAIAASAASISLWGVLGHFLFAVVVAAVVGYLVGKLNLIVRSRVKDATVNTVISFAVPFVASIPAELLGASGLAAAVVAGLVTGAGAARYLTPQHRLSDTQNWRTIELLLESTIFLILGLELSALVTDLEQSGSGVWHAAAVAAIALVLVLLVRALFVAPLLGLLERVRRRGARMKPVLADARNRLDGAEGDPVALKSGGREVPARSADRMRLRLRRTVADIDYLLAAPLGWRDGTVIVWAGMRGVVTLAAAQTLPADTPSRSLLVFVAFLVAAGSLLVQGATLPWVVRIVRPSMPDPAEAEAERREMGALLAQVAADVVAAHPETSVRERFQARLDSITALSADEADAEAAQHRALQLAIIAAQRQMLLAVRADGEFGASTLTSLLEALDAEQISIETREHPGAEH